MPTSRSSVTPSHAVPTVAEKITVGQTPAYIEVAPKGEFAYVANPGAGAITVLNTASDQVTGTIRIPQGPPQSVSFSPDSRTAYVSVYNGSNSVHLIAFIDTAAGTVTATVTVNNHAPGPSTTSPDGRYLYVPNHNLALTGPDENVIDVIDTASRKLVDSIPVAPNPHWIVFGKNGRVYASDHLSSVVTVLEASNNSIIGEVEVGEIPHSMAISPDGSRLAVTSYNGNEVFLINTAADQEVARIPVGRLPLEVAYSPDGRYIYTVDNEDNTVTVIDAADNRVIGDDQHLGAAQRAPGLRHRRERRHHRSPEPYEVRPGHVLSVRPVPLHLLRSTRNPTVILPRSPDTSGAGPAPFSWTI